MKVRFTLNGHAQVKTAQDLHTAIDALERLGISVDTLKVDPAGFDSSGSFLTDSYSYRQLRLPPHLRKMLKDD